jgi:hypothetical protein
MKYNIPKIKRQRWCKTDKVVAELKISDEQLSLLHFAVKNLPLEALHHCTYQTELELLALRDRLHHAYYWCEEDNVCLSVDYGETCPTCESRTHDPKNGKWFAPISARLHELGIV